MAPLFLALSCGVAVWAVVPAPDSFTWKLALLATECGHWLGLATAGVTLATVTRAARRGGRVRALALGAAGLMVTGLFFSTMWRARAVARSAPEEMERAFADLPGGLGGGAPARPAIADPALACWFPAGESAAAASVAPLRFQGRHGQALRGDLYLPGGAGPHPVVLMLHGGGWNSGDEKQIPWLNHWLTTQGWAVLAVTYRLAPAQPWPAQREDINDWLDDVLPREGPGLGLDTTRIVLMGRSAGAHLALCAAYGPPARPAVAGVISLYGPADMNFAYTFSEEDDILRSRSLMRAFMGGPPEKAGQNYDEASPIRAVGPQSPPTLLIHGVRDELVWFRQSERLAAALKQHGRPRYLLRLPWATHAFDFFSGGPSTRLTLPAIAWFLQKVRRP